MSNVAFAANVLSINGINVGAVASAVTPEGAAANLVAAFNAISTQTGVTAAASGADFTLTTADGRAISLGEDGSTVATIQGAVTLSSNNSQGITISGNRPKNAGLIAGTTAAQSTVVGLSLANADVLSVTDAQNAMVAIQGAINTVTCNAAALGAYQNRFSAVVTGIQTDSQNLSQSLARIQDTNYAQKTAVLSQEQVLAQAGTAMLAQTNQMPNQVLTLLR
jgi:flagellin